MGQWKEATSPHPHIPVLDFEDPGILKFKPGLYEEGIFVKVRE